MSDVKAGQVSTLMTRCRACGSVEVDVNEPRQVVEYADGPFLTGYGCEVCS